MKRFQGNSNASAKAEFAYIGYHKYVFTINSWVAIRHAHLGWKKACLHQRNVRNSSRAVRLSEKKYLWIMSRLVSGWLSLVWMPVTLPKPCRQAVVSCVHPVFFRKLDALFILMTCKPYLPLSPQGAFLPLTLFELKKHDFPLSCPLPVLSFTPMIQMRALEEDQGNGCQFPTNHRTGTTNPKDITYSNPRPAIQWNWRTLKIWPAKTMK